MELLPICRLKSMVRVVLLRAFTYLSPLTYSRLDSLPGRGRIPWIPISRDGGQMLLNKPVTLNLVNRISLAFLLCGKG